MGGKVGKKVEGNQEMDELGGMKDVFRRASRRFNDDF